jgi:hypothetical protein
VDLRLFADLVSLSVTRQELLFFDGGPAWRAPDLPGSCDYDRARYGTADIAGLGVKRGGRRARGAKAVRQHAHGKLRHRDWPYRFLRPGGIGSAWPR